jgi:hypothetical protein
MVRGGVPLWRLSWTKYGVPLIWYNGDRVLENEELGKMGGGVEWIIRSNERNVNGEWNSKDICLGGTLVTIHNRLGGGKCDHRPSWYMILV